MTASHWRIQPTVSQDGRPRIEIVDDSDGRRVATIVGHRRSVDEQREIARALIGDRTADFERRDRLLISDNHGLVTLQRQWVAPFPSSVDVTPDDLAYFTRLSDALAVKAALETPTPVR